MDLKIDKKTAIVFGGSAGIGKAIALQLAKEGVSVCIASRNEEKLEAAMGSLKSASQGQKIMSQICDMGSEADIERAIQMCEKELGPIDILINNQGGPLAGSFEKISEDQMVQAFQTNLLSFFRTIKRCLPSMKKRGWGRIINILSISAKEPIPNMFLSNVIRPALLGMAKTISSEVAQYNITINSVLPSAVLTERSESLVKERAVKEGKTIEVVLQEIASSLPSRTLATPEELAQVSVFLCGEGGRYINGSTISVDGASSKGLF